MIMYARAFPSLATRKGGCTGRTCDPGDFSSEYGIRTLSGSQLITDAAAGAR